MYEEYLRRNLLVAKAIGAKANASTALKRLEMQSRPPQWLVSALRGILERIDPLPDDLAKWRNLAPDAPDYIRDSRPATEIAADECMAKVRQHVDRAHPAGSCLLGGDCDHVTAGETSDGQ